MNPDLYHAGQNMAGVVIIAICVGITLAIVMGLGFMAVSLLDAAQKLSEKRRRARNPEVEDPLPGRGRRLDPYRNLRFPPY